MRTSNKKLLDFVTFPLRALCFHETDRFGLSSLATERYSYVRYVVTGNCLDIGCGRYNRFINEFCCGNGIGVDIFKYDGLNDDNVLYKLTELPFEDNSFSYVTFIACLNHAPYEDRQAELNEAYRVLHSGGKVVVTMGLPIIEVIAHVLAHIYSKVFRSYEDVDTERGMNEDENYFVSESEILRLMNSAGFVNFQKKPFVTQWGLNRMYIFEKK